MDDVNENYYIGVPMLPPNWISMIQPLKKWGEITVDFCCWKALQFRCEEVKDCAVETKFGLDAPA